MNLISRGETPKAHGRHTCLSCSSVVEVERSDLKQSLANKIDGFLLGKDKYHWECPVCFYRNDVSENWR